MKILKFGALWCNSCLVMRPRMAEIEKNFQDLQTEYYDFDQDKEMVEKYGIKSGVLPVFVFVSRSGKELARYSGEIEKHQMIQYINQYQNS